MKTLEELEKEKKEIEEKISKIKEEKFAGRRRRVSEKLSSLTEDQKNFLLSLIDHDRSSCSDENIANGLYSSSNGRWRCRKCMLIEVLNGEHGADYDFTFSVDFEELFEE